MSTAVEQLYIFDGLAKEEVAYFLLMCQTQMKKSGDTILTMGDTPNGCAYYLNSGHVKVSQKESEIALLGPGAFFGEIALITNEPRSATITAIDDVELQVFLKEDFFILLDKSTHAKEIKGEILRRIQENAKH